MVFLIFLVKQNATHSSSKPRLVERDFYFENVGRGPYYTNNWLIPSTGLVFIYSGEEPHRAGGWRGEVSGTEAEVRFQWLWSGGSSPTGTAVPGSVDSTWVSALEKVYGVGGSTVVPLYIQWVEPRLFPTLLVDGMVPPQSVYPSPPKTPSPPPPRTSGASCLSSCSCVWPGPRQTDGRTAT